MNLSSLGAMNDEDITLIKRGIGAILPHDRNGLPVLFWGRKRVPEPLDIILRCRLMFFLMHTAAQFERASQEGIVILWWLGSIKEGETTYKNSAAQLALDLIEKALPARIQRIHVIAFSQKSKRKVFFSWFVPFVLKQVKSFFSDLIEVHTSDTGKEIMATLESYNLDASGVPQLFGGRWSFETDLIEWCKEHGMRTHVANVAAIAAIEAKVKSIIKNESSALTSVVQELPPRLAEELLSTPLEELVNLIQAVNRIPHLFSTEVNVDRFLKADVDDSKLGKCRYTRMYMLNQAITGSAVALNSLLTYIHSYTSIGAILGEAHTRIPNTSFLAHESYRIWHSFTT
jgi:hypothetical protein